MNELTIDIITAESSLLVGAPASSVVAPGIQGAFEVLPGHTTFLTELETGSVTVEGPEGTQRFAVSGGFAEVMTGHVRILADQARAAGDIEAAAIEQGVKDVQAQLEGADPLAAETVELRKRLKFLEVQRTLLI